MSLHISCVKGTTGRRLSGRAESIIQINCTHALLHCVLSVAGLSVEIKCQELGDFIGKMSDMFLKGHIYFDL